MLMMASNTQANKYRPIQSWAKREQFIDDSGYVRVRVPEHPKSFRGGWVYEHRLVAEAQIGRVLKTYETCHHINEVKHDNSFWNIFVCFRTEHDRAHSLTMAVA